MHAARVAGVVVTYHPPADFSSRLAAIRAEVAPLLVVDNSADAGVQERLAAICANAGARLVVNRENRGLAAALNTGFTQLAEEGFVWAIAFDQDSRPERGFVPALLAMTMRSESGRICAAVGANWHDEARPTELARHVRPHRHCRWFFERVPAVTDLATVTSVITSGTLFNLPLWRSLGGFDERLFLDLVDTEYCLRAGAAGHRIAVASSARLAHCRGAKRPVQLAGRTCWPAFMPPFRLHLLFRNRLLLFRRYARQFPHWIAFELAYALKIVLEITWFEDRKAAKLAACARGTWDGLLGRCEPSPAPFLHEPATR